MERGSDIYAPPAAHRQPRLTYEPGTDRRSNTYRRPFVLALGTDRWRLSAADVRTLAGQVAAHTLAGHLADPPAVEPAADTPAVEPDAPTPVEVIVPWGPDTHDIGGEGG